MACLRVRPLDFVGKIIRVSQNTSSRWRDHALDRTNQTHLFRQLFITLILFWDHLISKIAWMRVGALDFVSKIILVSQNIYTRWINHDLDRTLSNQLIMAKGFKLWFYFEIILYLKYLISELDLLFLWAIYPMSQNKFEQLERSRFR